MEEVKLITIEDKPLNEVPEFSYSVAGNMIADSAGNVKNMKIGVFRRVVEAEFDLTIISGTGTHTYYHNLGYVPYVLGSYVIKSGNTSIGTAYPIGLRGQLPENREPEYGATTLHETRVSSANENSFTVTADLSGFDGALNYRVNIYQQSAK